VHRGEEFFVWCNPDATNTGEKGMKNDILERAKKALGADSSDELFAMIRKGNGQAFIDGLSDQDEEILDRWYRSRQDQLGR